MNALRALARSLVLVTGLLAGLSVPLAAWAGGPGQVRSWPVHPQGSVFPKHHNPWSHWGRPKAHPRSFKHGFVHPHRKFHHPKFHHRAHKGVRAVWVPAQWAWNGFGWVWIPGHWVRW